MICNYCGKELLEDNNIVVEDYIRIKKEWGYFSQKDGITQEFLLCEKCINCIVSKFKIPVNTYETNELI